MFKILLTIVVLGIIVLIAVNFNPRDEGYDNPPPGFFEDTPIVKHDDTPLPVMEFSAKIQSKKSLDNEECKPATLHDLSFQNFTSDTFRGNWSHTKAVGSTFTDCVFEGSFDSSLFDPCVMARCRWTKTSSAISTDFDGSYWFETIREIGSNFHKAQFADVTEKFVVTK